jgi:hypothetical protein
LVGLGVLRVNTGLEETRKEIDKTNKEKRKIEKNRKYAHCEEINMNLKTDKNNRSKEINNR